MIKVKERIYDTKREAEKARNIYVASRNYKKVTIRKDRDLPFSTTRNYQYVVTAWR